MISISAWRGRPEASRSAPMLAVLLRIQGRITWNRLRAGTARHPMRLMFLLVVVLPAFVALALTLLVTFGGGFGVAASEREATVVLGIMLTLAVLGSFIGATTAVLQSLYLARDTTFLMTLPIPLHWVFASKLVEAMIGTAPGVVLAGIVLIAYGLTRDASWIIIPAAILSLMHVPLLAMAAATIVVALVIGVIPARRARLSLFLATIAIVTLTMVAWSTVVPSPSADRGFLTQGSLVSLDASMRWLPTGHAARMVAAAAGRQWGSLAREACVTLMGTASALGVAYAVFALTYDRGRLLAATAGSARAGHITPRWMVMLARPLPGAAAAMVIKEWLTLTRDLKRLSGVVWPLGVIVFYAVSAIKQVPAGEAPAYRFWTEMAACAFLPWGFSLGTTIYTVGMEQRNIHLLRLLPVSSWRVLLGKLLAMLLPILLLSESLTLVFAIWRGATLGELAGIMAIVAWTSIGFVTIDLAAGALAPVFDAAHVQRSIALVGRAFGFAAGAAFGMVTATGVARLIVFSTGAPSPWREILAWRVGGITPLGWPLVVVAFGAGALICAGAFLLAKRSFDRILDEGP
ncbi:MAG: hypothetical protein KatS3mg059_1224 [Thermomicrobiales bacterium]|nr:MAG: hypothetical protein KatS3mg059_1224 [Thermomicrobiales bacterium]